MGWFWNKKDKEDDEPPLVTVAQYMDTVRAQLDRTRLEDAGIPCFLSNEFTSQLEFLAITQSDPMQLMVPRAAADLARSVLSEPGLELDSERSGEQK